MPPNFQQPSAFPPQPSTPKPNTPSNQGESRPTPPPMPPRPTAPIPPPVMPTIQMHPTPDGHNKFIKPLLIILVVVIVLAGALAFMRSYTGSSKQNFSSENVKVEDNKGQTPTGLPKDFPIEEKNILQSSTLVYPDRHATLYSVLFTSLKQTEELYSMYKKYLSENSFTMLNESKSSTQMSYRGVNGKNELSIILTPKDALTEVQISYITRQ
ncbi:MAG: hypothetical protein WA051_01925 [Minisyncoccia bacterium]